MAIQLNTLLDLLDKIAPESQQVGCSIVESEAVCQRREGAFGLCECVSGSMNIQNARVQFYTINVEILRERCAFAEKE